jgi:pyruvate/2-oxoglutarate dehydrogenase complex dihydrolipoamide acyltransferase (E2) component
MARPRLTQPTADHRVVDGASGAVFLQQLTSLLKRPLCIVD